MSKLLILNVDDDPIDLENVHHQLKQLEAVIIDVKNGQEALEMLRQRTFDCILLDHLLPDCRGVDLVAQFQQLDITTPVIIITGVGDEQLAVTALKSGAANYITKEALNNGKLSQDVLNAVLEHRSIVEAKTKAIEKMHNVEIAIDQRIKTMES